MRHFTMYLVFVAFIAFMLLGTVGEASRDITCTLGSYGAVVQGCPR